MNLGLGTLHNLKSFILPDKIAGQDDYDTALQGIGLGVAAQIENFCVRRFGRAEFDSCEFNADLLRYYLPRTPVERLVKIEKLGNDGEPLDTVWWWTDDDADFVTDRDGRRIEIGRDGAENLRPLVRLNKRSGMVELHDLRADGILRATWSGGYWFETREQDKIDESGPSEMPAGATSLPRDLQLAWQIQCQHVFECNNHLLTKGLSGEETIKVGTRDIQLTGGVKELLRPFVRYQLL
jgi:hypothetical protein